MAVILDPSGMCQQEMTERRAKFGQNVNYSCIHVTPKSAHHNRVRLQQA